MSDAVEFFVHSPFAKTVGTESIPTNEAALIVHATFEINGFKTRYFIIGDAEADVLTDIVEITQKKDNRERLIWDIYNIPHHCSYLALNNDEKGEYETVPLEAICKLLDYGNKNCYLISSSDKIKENDQKQPPHIQAYRAYCKYCKKRKIFVTMEYPNSQRPIPIVLEIGENGAMEGDYETKGAAAIIEKRAPRAGER